ncbi:MAG: DUF6482 family protein [Vibrio sp.]
MKKHQLDLWLQASKNSEVAPPKIFVVSCADLSCYSLAVEYKHKLEPIRDDEELTYFESLDAAKEALCKMGISSVYLRQHNAYDEFGPEVGCCIQDTEIRIAAH